MLDKYSFNVQSQVRSLFGETDYKIFSIKIVTFAIIIKQKTARNRIFPQKTNLNSQKKVFVCLCSIFQTNNI